MIREFCTVFLVSVLVPSFLVAQKIPDSKPSDICSIFESVVTNAASLQSGDFLVRERQTFDSTDIDETGAPEGALLKKTNYSRIIFDDAAGQYAHYGNGVGFRTLFPEKDESKSVKFTGWCCDGPQGNVAKLSKIDRSFVKDRSEYGTDIELLRNEYFPDYRGFWLYRGPSIYGALNDDKTLRAMRNGKFFHSSRTRGKKLDIYFESGVQVANEGDSFLKIYTFDLELLVCTNIRAELTRGGEKHTIGSFEIGWKEMNGVMVPVSGRLEKIQNMQVNVDSIQAGKFHQEFDFHWFSVNEEIDRRLFSIDNVKDRNAVLSMIDPVKVNATSLIDKDPTEK